MQLYHELECRLIFFPYPLIALSPMMLILYIEFAALGIAWAATASTAASHPMAAIDILLRAADLAASMHTTTTTASPATARSRLDDVRSAFVCNFLRDHYRMGTSHIAIALEPLLANATIPPIPRSSLVRGIHRCRVRLHLPRPGFVFESIDGEPAPPTRDIDARPLERDDDEAIARSSGSSLDHLASGSSEAVSEATDDEWTGDGGLKRARDEAPRFDGKRRRSWESGRVSAIDLGIRRRAITRSFVEENPSMPPNRDSARLIESIMLDAGIPRIRLDSIVALLHSCRREVGLEAPLVARNPETAQRMQIVDAFVKEHYQASNVEMIGPIIALFESASIPTVLPTTLQDLISKSRARQGLLTKIRSR